MFSHQFYNVVHIVGIVLIVAALAGISIHALNGGTRQTNAARGLVFALHGTGALLVLLGGFGMLARLGFRHGASFPGWIVGKLIVWGVLAILIALPYRRPATAKAVFLLAPVLVGIAAYLAIYKPI